MNFRPASAIAHASVVAGAGSLQTRVKHSIARMVSARCLPPRWLRGRLHAAKLNALCVTDVLGARHGSFCVARRRAEVCVRSGRRNGCAVGSAQTQARHRHPRNPSVFRRGLGEARSVVFLCGLRLAGRAVSRRVLVAGLIGVEKNTASAFGC